MHIIVNSKPHEIRDKACLRDLVAHFSKTPEHVIAELNGAIVTKEDWPATRLNVDDKIELITFVGGG